MTLNVHLAEFPDVSIALYCNKADCPYVQNSPGRRVGYSIRLILTLSVKTGSVQVICASTEVRVCTMSLGQPVTIGLVLSGNEQM